MRVADYFVTFLKNEVSVIFISSMSQVENDVFGNRGSSVKIRGRRD
jgi:hypothetical protein